jgi:3-dehydroquinate synthetase
VISDPELFDLVAKGKGSFLKYRDEILRRAVAVKINIVRKDPFDRDQRQTLNFGHTLGHAVEFVSGYTMSHGEAIAIGMTAETNLAEQLGLAASGLTEELINVLQRWELPVKVPPNLEEEAIWEAVKRDKKKSGGRLQFALPVAVGQVKARIEVEDSNLKSAFNIVKRDIYD